MLCGFSDNDKHRAQAEAILSAEEISSVLIVLLHENTIFHETDGT